jgi:hypothetical protein
VKLSERALNRSTLRRQLLLERAALSVTEGVRRVVALQAQQPPSPYLALWNRLESFDPAELHAAFVDRSVVKATLMRITLHAVHADDHAAFRAAMLPTLRAAGLNDRFTASGLTIDDADAMVPDLLAFMAEPRTHADIAAWLRERLGREAPGGVWRGMRAIAPLVHAPGGAPWSFGDRPAYVAAGSLASAEPGSPDRALEALLRRYLEGFGPATIADVARFAMVQRARVKATVEALGDALDRLEGPSGTVLFDVPGSPPPDEEDAPAPPRLLPMWDSVLLAYDDRSRVVPEAYRTVVARANGDVLPTIIVDGRVAGVWRPADGGIECTAFHRLRRDVWEALAMEAAALGTFLAERDPHVYRRYDHWWSRIRGDQIRLLPGV